MALLFCALVARGSTPEALDEGADDLARHLSLRFVPAGAGVMLYVHQLAFEWLSRRLCSSAGSCSTRAVCATGLRAASPSSSLAHGIGTARAFAGLAFGMHRRVAAIVVPAAYSPGARLAL